MQPIPENHSLRRFFAGLVDNVFCGELGVGDPCLTRYLADLLVSFTHIDRFDVLERAEGRRWDQVAAMLILVDEPPTSSSERERLMYRNIGDYALFWSGVYPEQLQRSRRRRSDVLLDYVSQGKRSYAIVSRLPDESDRFPALLYRQLSDDFESCMHGLGLVRRHLQQDVGGNVQPPDLVI
jgi:hypothetical protein